MRLKRAIQFVVGIAIAAAGLYIFLRGSDIGELARELRATDPFVFLLCSVLAIVSLVLRAVRWRIMLPEVEGAHTENLFSHTIIGFMINNIVPARAGEAARALLLWRKNGYSPAVSVGSLVLERIIDILIYMLFFSIPALLLPELSALARPAWIVLAIAAASIAVLVLCCRYPAIITRTVGMTSRITPKRFAHRISVIGEDLMSVLDWSRSPMRLLWMVVLSLVIPLLFSANAMLLVGDYRLFGTLHGSFVVSFAVLGAAIPLAPGYVGTIHATILQSFVFLGLEENAGRTMAVLFHAIGYLPVTIVGFIYFLKADMSFKEISHAKEVMEE